MPARRLALPSVRLQPVEPRRVAAEDERFCLGREALSLPELGHGAGEASVDVPVVRGVEQALRPEALGDVVQGRLLALAGEEALVRPDVFAGRTEAADLVTGEAEMVVE